MTASRLIVLTGVVCLCFSRAHAQSVRYVDDSATGANNGSSWCNAYRHLQDALTAASGGGVAEIRVAQGVYKPDRSNATPSGSGDRNDSFYLITGVALRGGYAGCGAPNPDARAVAVYETILDGDLDNNDAENPTDYFSCCFPNNTTLFNCQNPGCVAAVCAAAESCCQPPWLQACVDLAETLCANICDTPTRGENAYQVVTAISVANTAILDGFTITGGHADGPSFGADPASRNQGGGLNNYYGRPRVMNCTFRDNWSDDHGAINDHGGVTLNDTVFRQNYAGDHAGGLYVHNSGMGPVAVTDCLFDSNETTGQGGGAYKKTGNSQTTFTRCTFTGNKSVSTGGGLYSGSSAISLTGCTFAGNESLSYGGGAYLAGGPLTVTDSTFNGNSSVGGGGLYVGFAHGTVSNCIFDGNITPLGEGGGLYIAYNSSPLIEDCLFRQNSTVGDGGGVYMNIGAEPIFNRCTFVNNHARRAGGLYSGQADLIKLNACRFIANTADYAGGAYVYRDEAMFTNCLFNGNTATDSGGGIISAFSRASLVNCTIFGNTAASGGGVLTQGSVPNSPEVTIMENSILWNNASAGVTDQAAQVYNTFGSVPVVNHSCVQGWDGTLNGTGSIPDNPLFVDPNGSDNLAGNDDDDLRLSNISPAIDSGNSATLPPDVTTDLDGKPRVVSLNVDMGAYETDGPSAIPTMSEWGVLILTGLLLSAGGIVLANRRRSDGEAAAGT